VGLTVTFVGNTGVVGNPSGRFSQSSQVRVINVAKVLRKDGMRTMIVFPLRDSIRSVSWAIEEADICVFHRIQGSRSTWVDFGYLNAFATARRLRKKIVFDVDDAIHLNFPLVAQSIALASSAIFAGSHSLFETYRHYNKKVVLVPSAVDTDVITPIPHRKKEGLVLGWHGSVRVHLDNLLSLTAVLSRLSKRYDFRFRILGTAGDLNLQRKLQGQFTGVGLDFGPAKWFDYAELPYYMSDVDIGLYPLLDSMWNRAKCSMKLLEYMAMELPSCSSRAGENRYIIDTGANGYLAADDSEWVDKIGRLIDDPDLRRRIGLRARADVLRSFSLQNVSKSIESIIGG
jgi:glycosyltransferase involved in cell wall biosynthesis